MTIATTLTWEPPDYEFEPDDYLVEYREIDTDDWTAVSPPPTDTTTVIEGLDETKAYEYRVTPRFSTYTGTGAIVETLPDPKGLPIYVRFNAGSAGRDHWTRTLAFVVRWGGTGRSYVDRVPTANGLITLDNADDHYDINTIRVNDPVEIGIVIAGNKVPIGSGWISRVENHRQPVTRSHTITVMFQGLFGRMSQEDGTVFYYGIEVRPISDVVTDLVRQLINPARMHVARSHARVAAFQEGGLLAGSQPVMPLLRRLELLEDGWMHEGRGADFHFESQRWRDAFSTLQGVFTVDKASRATEVQIDNTRPDWFYEYLYTRVSLAGTEVTKGNKPQVVWKVPSSYRATIDALSTHQVDVSLDNSIYRAIDNVRQVQEANNRPLWDRLRYTIVNPDPGDDDPTELRVEVPLIGVDASHAYGIVTNSFSEETVVKELEATGWALLRDTTYESEKRNTAAEETYNLRRTLQLGSPFDGLGFLESNTKAAIEQNLEEMLERHSMPKYTRRIEWDAGYRKPGETSRVPLALRRAAEILPSDHVHLTDANAHVDSHLDNKSNWYVEGGDLTFSANGNPTFMAGLNLSRRDH
ncbi:MAG: fibronectin type III domain-containing protein [Rhodospirillaceae bacterium]|nr:fibronectin type III domain-containing protein [Rhodospirillaceae bacterium]